MELTIVYKICTPPTHTTISENIARRLPEIITTAKEERNVNRKLLYLDNTTFATTDCEIINAASKILCYILCMKEHAGLNTSATNGSQRFGPKNNHALARCRS